MVPRPSSARPSPRSPRSFEPRRPARPSLLDLRRGSEDEGRRRDQGRIGRASLEIDDLTTTSDRLSSTGPDTTRRNDQVQDRADPSWPTTSEHVQVTSQRRGIIPSRVRASFGSRSPTPGGASRTCCSKEDPTADTGERPTTRTRRLRIRPTTGHRALRRQAHHASHPSALKSLRAPTSVSERTRPSGLEHRPSPVLGGTARVGLSTEAIVFPGLGFDHGRLFRSTGTNGVQRNSLDSQVSDEARTRSRRRTADSENGVDGVYRRPEAGATGRGADTVL